MGQARIHDQWSAIGFSVEAESGRALGLTGTVSTVEPEIQLHCKEAADPRFRAAGASGSPILVNDVVAGILVGGLPGQPGGTKGGVIFATPINRLPSGLIDKSPRTVIEAIDLATRFDRIAPWGMLTDALGHADHIFMPVIGCDKQGVGYFLDRIVRLRPVADQSHVVLPFRLDMSRAGPQVAEEWVERLRAQLRAPSVAAGIAQKTQQGPLFIIIGPIKADRLTRAERKALGQFVVKHLAPNLASAAAPVHLILGFEFLGAARKPFDVDAFLGQTARWAARAKYVERPGGGRRMLMMTEPLKLPPWSEAEGILAKEGVSYAVRLELRSLYEAWLKSESFATIANLLERELGAADEDDEEDDW